MSFVYCISNKISNKTFANRISSQLLESIRVFNITLTTHFYTELMPMMTLYLHFVLGSAIKKWSEKKCISVTVYKLEIPPDAVIFLMGRTDGQTP